MLELGSSGSVRGVLSNEHPYRHPRSIWPVSQAVAERPLFACAVRRRRFPVGASPTRRTLQPEATGAVMEVTKWLKPSV